MREARLVVCLIIAVQKSVAKHIATFHAGSTLHMDILQLTVWRASIRSGFARQPVDRKGASGRSGAFQDNSRVAGATHVR
jgi:hypothetical protein